MADRRGLKLIGWMLGSITAAVMLVAALLVHDALVNLRPVAPPPLSSNIL